jgi:hypothetical protein
MEVSFFIQLKKEVLLGAMKQQISCCVLHAITNVVPPRSHDF